MSIDPVRFFFYLNIGTFRIENRYYGNLLAVIIVIHLKKDGFFLIH